MFSRTTAITLSALLATVAALSACSIDKSTQARLAIAKFGATCPTQMKTQFASDSTFSSLGDSFLTSMSSDTCTCIEQRLKALPPEKVVELDHENASEKEIETLVSPCAAIAIKPHISELCMAGVKQGGGDERIARPRCECAQRKVKKMDDATFEKTFANVGQGFSSVAESCLAAE